MKQVLQHSRSGAIEIAEVPLPKLLSGCVLVRIAASLVSPGTERASSEFAKKNLYQKARARPDLVREVIGKFRRDGLFSTIETVRSRLDQPGALGYSSAGTVIAAASDVHDLRVGDRVACAGAGYAVHAEVSCIPRLLAAKLPSSSVSFEDAAFTTLGAVALHGLRTAEVNLGDLVAVIGLGLLGQLAVQLLKAAGCRVIGLDLQSERAGLARQLGADGATNSADQFRAMCEAHSSCNGVDSVVITAETLSSDPVNLAAEVARDRAVITAVGTVGMDLQRKSYYEKELDFRISRSYGPGRYDSAYEQKGRDYPIGYVRWTETRNMEAFLRLLADQKIDVRSLVTHRFDIGEAQSAYQCIADPLRSRALGVLITYPIETSSQPRLEVVNSHSRLRAGEIRVGMLGAGNFACSTLIPAIRRESSTELIGVCSANGSHSRAAARKFGFQYCADGENEILNDPRINTVIVATRHHLHAQQVAAALRAGKHVFCEKPLCLNEIDLAGLVDMYTGLPDPPVLMVGFNRRFAPMTVELKRFLSAVDEPLTMHYRVNAGPLPADHWINDPEQGGGRLIGEVCHFIDLLCFLAESKPVEVTTHAIGESNQSYAVSMRLANGSQGTITYAAGGDRSFSKERIEVFGGGGAAALEDFRLLEMVGHGKRKTVRSRFRQDKGHRAEWVAFVNSIKAGGGSPIPLNEILTSTLATFCAEKSRASGRPVAVDKGIFGQSVPPVLKLESC